MTASSTLARQLAFGTSLALLLLLAALGLFGGMTDIRTAHTAVETIQTGSQIAYGLLSLVTACVTLWVRRIGLPLQLAWLIAIVTAAGLAGPAWGGTTALAGIAAGLAAFGVGLVILWLLHFGAPRRAGDAEDGSPPHTRTS